MTDMCKAVMDIKEVGRRESRCNQKRDKKFKKTLINSGEVERTVPLVPRENRPRTPINQCFLKAYSSAGNGCFGDSHCRPAAISQNVINRTSGDVPSDPSPAGFNIRVYARFSFRISVETTSLWISSLGRSALMIT